MFIFKIAFYLLFFHNLLVFAQPGIIILYGCSSSGKTSVATALQKILPGSWAYIASNRFKGNASASQNKQLWQAVNQKIAHGFNVIVDTHASEFLITPAQKSTTLTVLLYCSPEKLLDHVLKRNLQEDKQTHRALRSVYKEFCKKYQAVQRDQPHIDTLHKKNLKNHSFTVYFALRKIISTYFDTADQKNAYLAPRFKAYDCLIDTGKESIDACAKQITELFLKKINNTQNL